MYDLKLTEERERAETVRERLGRPSAQLSFLKAKRNYLASTNPTLQHDTLRLDYKTRHWTQGWEVNLAWKINWVFMTNQLRITAIYSIKKLLLPSTLSLKTLVWSKILDLLIRSVWYVWYVPYVPVLCFHYINSPQV